MAIPAQTVKIVISGSLHGVEEFSTGFWLGGLIVNTESALQALVDLVRDDFQTHLRTLVRSQITTTSSYDTVRAYSYPGGGPVATLQAEAAIATGTGTGANTMPTQVSWVASLRTGFSGRRSRGRMYFPCFSPTLQADLQWSAVQAQAMADAVANFFTAVNSIPGGGPVSVVSQVGVGQVRSVTDVVVDTRPDIQRRRAESAPPTATTTSAV